MTTGMQAASEELDEAGRALEAFASGPARQAAAQIEAVFARAGTAVRSELAQIARSGEADLDRLARKLAQVLAEFAVRQAFGDGRQAPVNLVMNVAGSVGGGAQASAGQIAAAAARAVRRGARFA